MTSRTLNLQSYIYPYVRVKFPHSNNTKYATIDTIFHAETQYFMLRLQNADRIIHVAIYCGPKQVICVETDWFTLGILFIQYLMR